MHRIRNSQRPGVSIVEVVIVLLVVVGLVTVGIMALRQWWESSARLRCEFHLQKLGVAMAVHQDKRKHLPASWLDKGYATWAVQLAPFVEEDSVAELKKWDLAKTYYQQPDAVRQSQLLWFYCPSRRYPPQLSSGEAPEGGGVDNKQYPGALGDYACAVGDGSTDWKSSDATGAIIPARVIQKEGDLLIKWELQTSLGTLPRGDSPTILLGEKHVPWGQFGQVAAGDGSLYNGDYPASAARIGGPKHPLAQSTTDPFNINFGSAHPGLCQFLMADGGVQPFSTAMSMEVLAKLINRNPP